MQGTHLRILRVPTSIKHVRLLKVAQRGTEICRAECERRMVHLNAEVSQGSFTFLQCVSALALQSI